MDHDDDRPWTDFCHLEAGDNRCASSHDHYPQNNMTNVSQLPRSTHYNGCYRYQSPDRTTRIQHVDDYSGDDCEAYASHFGAHDDTLGGECGGDAIVYDYDNATYGDDANYDDNYATWDDEFAPRDNNTQSNVDYYNMKVEEISRKLCEFELKHPSPQDKSVDTQSEFASLLAEFEGFIRDYQSTTDQHNPAMSECCQTNAPVTLDATAIIDELANDIIYPVSYVYEDHVCTADPCSPSVEPDEAACPIVHINLNNDASHEDIPPSKYCFERERSIISSPTLVMPVDELYCVNDDILPSTESHMEKPRKSSYEDEKSISQMGSTMRQPSPQAPVASTSFISKDQQYSSTTRRTLEGQNAGNKDTTSNNECADFERLPLHCLPSSPTYTIDADKTCTTGFAFYHRPFEDWLPSVEGECYHNKAQLQPARTCNLENQARVLQATLPGPSYEVMPTSIDYTLCNGEGKRDNTYSVLILCSTEAKLEGSSLEKARANIIDDCGRDHVHNKPVYSLITRPIPTEKCSSKQPYKLNKDYAGLCHPCFEDTEAVYPHCCGRQYGSNVKMKDVLKAGVYHAY